MQGCHTHFDLHRRDDVALATPLIKSMTEIGRFRKVGQASDYGGEMGRHRKMKLKYQE